jgi:hypothetical protein
MANKSCERYPFHPSTYNTEIPNEFPNTYRQPN